MRYCVEQEPYVLDHVDFSFSRTFFSTWPFMIHIGAATPIRSSDNFVKSSATVNEAWEVFQIGSRSIIGLRICQYLILFKTHLLLARYIMCISSNISLSLQHVANDSPLFLNAQHLTLSEPPLACIFCSEFFLSLNVI